jgi:bifunctional DNase/RNase
LAQVLLGGPDVLLLDEPTNHLDILSIRWLEKFLCGYRGAALIRKTPLGAYLCKFAVEREAQGEGLGRDIWQLVVSDHKSLFWRARPDNAIAPFYVQECDGMVRTEQWNVFWKGLAPERIPDEFRQPYALRGIKPPRPPTHQLIAEVITALGTELDHVELTALRDNIFHADLVLADDVRVSARPSDAVALALHADRPIRATDELLDLVGTTAFTLDRAEPDPDEAEIARFRSELDDIDPDDFTSG